MSANPSKIPVRHDIDVVSGSVLPGQMLQLYQRDHTASSPSYDTSVAGATYTWHFRRYAGGSTVLDASSAVSVFEAATGTLRVGPLTTTQTDALTGTGVYDVRKDGLIILDGTWTATGG